MSQKIVAEEVTNKEVQAEKGRLRINLRSSQRKVTMMVVYNWQMRKNNQLQRLMWLITDREPISHLTKTSLIF